eukprot:s1025_g1.t1
MHLCKVYDMSQSSFAGSEIAQQFEEHEAMKQGIKMFKQLGFNGGNSKSLMRILLINALGSTMAMDSSAVQPLTTGVWRLFLAFLFTMICLLVGFLWVTTHYGAELQQRLRRLQIDMNLRRVLELLREAGGRSNGQQEMMEEETPVVDPPVDPTTSDSDESEIETTEQKYRRYRNSSMDEVSDPDLWMIMHHGPPERDDAPQLHRNYADVHLELLMRQTNDVLNQRLKRLQRDYEQAALVNDYEAMEILDNQMLE